MKINNDSRYLILCFSINDLVEIIFCEDREEAVDKATELWWNDEAGAFVCDRVEGILIDEYASSPNYPTPKTFMRHFQYWVNPNN